MTDAGRLRNVLIKIREGGDRKSSTSPFEEKMMHGLEERFGRAKQMRCCCLTGRK